MRRTRQPFALALIAAGLLATTLTACSGDDEDPPPTTSARATPTTSPAAKIVAPLLDLDEVDVAKLPLPDAPDGVNPAAWKSSTESLRSLAVASLDESIWDTPAGPALVAKVARAAPERVALSMAKSVSDSDPAVALFWGPTFAPRATPIKARTVDARWTSTTSDGAGKPMKIALIQFTTVYAIDKNRHVVIERQFGLGSTRPAPDVGAFAWTVGTEVGGEDTCRSYTDATLAAADSPDLEQLSKVVDHVVEQSDIDTTFERTDIAAARKKACSPDV